MATHLSGILLLDKPINMTSNVALQKVKRLFNAKKAGHTGSLDPIATGMLPICFGEATKFSQYLLESDKHYHVTMQLGVATTTGDIEGEVSATNSIPAITLPMLDTVLKKFTGPITQIPPMFSALKHNGQPLYKLARAGQTVERAPRPVMIYALNCQAQRSDQLELYVHCSKGTYVRTLVEDIAIALGTCAHVIALRRTVVSGYAEVGMHTLSDLTSEFQAGGPAAIRAHILPLETAVQSYPILRLATASAFYLCMGQAVRIANACHEKIVRLYDDKEKFLGMGEINLDGSVKPLRLVAQS